MIPLTEVIVIVEGEQTLEVRATYARCGNYEDTSEATNVVRFGEVYLYTRYVAICDIRSALRSHRRPSSRGRLKIKS